MKTRKNASSVTVNDKIYVLGGENEQGACKNLSQHMTRKKKVWEELPEYPGSETGICKASLISYKNEIYVIGGQTGTGANAAALKHIYVFNAESKNGQQKQI